MAKRCKVLIIVGGGIFGAIPAHFLGMLPSDKQTMNGIDVINQSVEADFELRWVELDVR